MAQSYRDTNKMLSSARAEMKKGKLDSARYLADSVLRIHFPGETERAWEIIKEIRKAEYEGRGIPFDPKELDVFIISDKKFTSGRSDWGNIAVSRDLHGLEAKAGHYFVIWQISIKPSSFWNIADLGLSDGKNVFPFIYKLPPDEYKSPFQMNMAGWHNGRFGKQLTRERDLPNHLNVFRGKGSLYVFQVPDIVTELKVYTGKKNSLGRGILGDWKKTLLGLSDGVSTLNNRPAISKVKIWLGFREYIRRTGTTGYPLETEHEAYFRALLEQKTEGQIYREDSVINQYFREMLRDERPAYQTRALRHFSGGKTLDQEVIDLIVNRFQQDLDQDYFKLLVRISVKHKLKESLPYLRERYKQKQSDTDLFRALKTLGDTLFLESNSLIAAQSAVDQFIEEMDWQARHNKNVHLSSKASRLLTLIKNNNGVGLLKKHYPEKVLCLDDSVRISSKHFVYAGDSLHLVFKPDKPSGRDAMFIDRNNNVGWIKMSHFHWGPVPDQLALQFTLNKLWAEKRYVEMMPYLKLMRIFSDRYSSTGIVPDKYLTDYLAKLKLYEHNGRDGEASYVRVLDSLNFRGIVGDSAPEALLHITHGGWEGYGKELQIMKYNTDEKEFQTVLSTSLGGGYEDYSYTEYILEDLEGTKDLELVTMNGYMNGYNNPALDREPELFNLKYYRFSNREYVEDSITGPVLNFMIQYIDDKEDKNRILPVLRELDKQRHKDLRGILTKCVSHNDLWVSAYAIDELKTKFGDSSQLDQLISRVDTITDTSTNQSGLYRYVLGVLGESQSPRALAALKRRMDKTTDRQTAWLNEIIASMGKIGSLEAESAILSTMEERKERFYKTSVIYSVIRAINFDSSLGILAEIANKDTQYVPSVAYKLIQLKTDKSLNMLLDLYQNSGAKTQQKIASQCSRAMGLYGRPVKMQSALNTNDLLVLKAFIQKVEEER
ncbi:MAG: hypothetical protein HEP71_23255 [Roseivirga sp.]|nr:hypothetical protein [Roseivirga sp.]